uniref:DRTGG domain-containing protein n=1 Tax=Eutreptiella gymnastica TaxID=73025 RepID=A0A7S1N4H2_9EUGL|mmetsp:Transcript_115552/g.201081  ORF Transcript_115552/g.201081 Transcript_115552/m.201081 type:complete len:391 (+) Transcript_115552:86-1258(+)
MSKPRALFVAATKQHIGKTSSCVGLMGGLQERFSKVGYIKPVGQQHVPVEGKDGATIRVDKDVRLFKEFFGLNHIDYSDMSPLLVPSGYTKQFLDGHVCTDAQINDIHKCFQQVVSQSDFTILEGTGHCGVGSIIEMDNARVASLLGVDMVLVCNAGIGSSFDELELNRLLCQKYGVNLKGVILNRVQEDKYTETKKYFEKALSRWGVPLVGCIPYNAYLQVPCMMDYENLFKAHLSAGGEMRMRHFDKQILMATSLSRFMNLLQLPEYSNTLWVTHSSRHELVLALVEHVRKCEAEGTKWRGGLILAGTELDEDGRPRAACEQENADDALVREALSNSSIPVLYIKHGVTHALAKINKYTAKLNADDQKRTRAALEHVQPCLDFDRLLA